jgi:solute carrier family 25 2-oxodicarboxylate transporter 21
MTTTCSADQLAYAGGAAGVIEAVIIQPLEIVKVRFQLNQGTNSTIGGCFRDLIREGGVVRLYRGLMPEVLGMFPTRSACYASQELFKRELVKIHGRESALVAGVAGGLAGVIESAATTPFQLIKVRLQAPENNAKYSGTLDCAQKVLLEEGVLAFSTGFVSTAMRNSVWNAIYFSFMFNARKLVERPDSYLLGLVQTVAIGFCGGITATSFNCPLDVAKSRIQAQTIVEGVAPKYTGTISTLTSIAREEGLGALYKGFYPKALRMGLGGGVALSSFEAICKVLGTVAPGNEELA